MGPSGVGCVDVLVQSPLSLRPCERNPNASTSTQALLYDPTSGHLGRTHPMQDGTMMGYVNIAAGDKPDPQVSAKNLQFTRSYGPDQPNEEYIFENGTFRDRCGEPTHTGCPARCVIANHSLPPVGNNAENLAQGIGWQLWQKPLSDGSVAVFVINRDVSRLDRVVLDFRKLGVDLRKATGGVRVRDLYARMDIALIKAPVFTPKPIGPHDSIMLKLTPVA